MICLHDTQPLRPDGVRCHHRRYQHNVFYQPDLRAGDPLGMDCHPVHTRKEANEVSAK